MSSSRRYAEAGVDIEAGQRAVDAMKSAVRSTFNRAVLTDVGAFGGLFALNELPDCPVLVASTDGVGTKVALAGQFGRWHGIGMDIVHHCVNDILVQGARPLFFLDYIASDKLQVDVIASIVEGIAAACRAIDCPLLGGETAEMPGVYAPGALDIAGTIVGVVGREQILPRPDRMQAGDRLFGLPSSGPHTNGYSLIRRLLSEGDRSQTQLDSRPIVDWLLEPHRCYLAEIERLRQADVELKGLAHLTGGGVQDNLPRILPEDLSALLSAKNWPTTPLFELLCRWGEVDREEAFSIFNMGIGMILVLDQDSGDEAQRLFPEMVALGELTARPNESQVVWN